jgi:filamentous hemagglutinin
MTSALYGWFINKGLASESQAAQIMNGKGIPIAGAGTDVALRESTRLATQYGGAASNWAKVTSWSYKAADGTRFEVHAYQNLVTGKIVEFKTKFPE